MPNLISKFIGSEVSRVLKVDEKQKIGIGGFYMMATISQGYTKNSSIPFVPLENGSYAVDHIVQNPLMLNIEGTVADIYETPSPLLLAYMRALGEIGNIDRYLPDYTRQQINSINNLLTDVTNQINKIDGLLNTGEQLFDLFSPSTSKGITEQFLDFMNAIMDNDQVIQIELPTMILDNMAISNFQVNYPHEYANGIEFRITAFQIRYANTIVENSTDFYKNPSNSVRDQITGADDKGINKTKDVPQSVLSSTKENLQKYWSRK